ncbi:hypothetical protein U9M48_024865 [Paspalum notatum var. saurae]|uniref:Subtilisin-like protease fibronectin type-III domain-containing protein n=1 Tax=Paspalum notatum var. saurae TaxID=547442 RepID=A0AAQ3TS17_PASNO
MGIIFTQRNSNLIEATDQILCKRWGMQHCVLVDFKIAHRIVSYVNSAEMPVVRMSRPFTVVRNGVASPRVAAFSSRGPSPAFPGLNLPSIAVPDLKDSPVTVRRTVTNVGPADASYRAVVEASPVVVSVEPSMTRFVGGAGGSNKATFQVTLFTARHRVQGGYMFGSLTWVDGGAHSV